jgi:nucleotide sugar dehydrogenase
VSGPKVAVVGLGKIGLPVAAQFASAGAVVVGCDVDERVVAMVNHGACPIANEPGLAEAVAEARRSGRLQATTDTAGGVAESGVVVCVVPVAIDDARRPDFGHLDAATAAIAAGLRPGTLVILETTVPVGATRQRFGKRLALGSGLALGDFDLAYSPERVSSGQVLRDLRAYPKIVGGVSPEAGHRAAAFYRHMLGAEVTVLPDAETAEFTKLAESVYRDVNIALANELAIAADTLGVDYATAAKAANSQPYSHLHTPGVGVGGHCIPVYPYFLLDVAPGQSLTARSREVNDSMAAYAARRLDAALREAGLDGLARRTVLILGLAYRGNVRESAFSSALLLSREIEAAGATALVHDPLFAPEEIAAEGLRPAPLPPGQPVDAVVLQAAHRDYEALDFAAIPGCRVVLDGRGALDRGPIEAAGLRYIAIGDGALRHIPNP